MVSPIDGNNYSRCFVGKNTPTDNRNCPTPPKNFKNVMMEVKEEQRPLLKYGIYQPPHKEYVRPPFAEMKYGINLPSKPFIPPKQPVPEVEPKYGINIPSTPDSVIEKEDTPLPQTKYGINQ